MFAGRGGGEKRGGSGGEQSVLPEGTKRQRVARRQDASEAHEQPMPERSGGREPKAQAMSKTRSGLRRHGRFVFLVFVYKIATERRRTELPRASAKRERSPGSEQRNREIFLMFKEKRRQQKKAEKRRDG